MGGRAGKTKGVIGREDWVSSQRFGAEHGWNEAWPMSVGCAAGGRPTGMLPAARAELFPRGNQEPRPAAPQLQLPVELV